MTDATAAVNAGAALEDRTVGEAAASGWNAELALRFEREGPRTVLRARRHVGPLRVQKALYPEGDLVCQVVVVHPPAGIVAGESLATDLLAVGGASGLPWDPP